MSKIQTELCNAAEIDPKRGEDRADFLLRLALGVNKLPDAQWEKLSPEAQDWVNKASDAANAKQALPEMPDVDPPASSGRRRVAEEKEGPYEPKLKDDVNVTTKRGKVIAGKIVEMDKEVIVIKTTTGDEEELNRDRIEKIEPLGGGSSAKKEEPPKEPGVGDVLTITTKRGKVVTGECVELDKEVVVLKVDGAEEEFSRDRVEKIEVQKARAAESGGSSRRSADKEEPKKEEKDSGGGRTRSTNNGVSIGTRIRELIVDNMSASEDDIAKLLKKEDLEFRENTLKLNYAEAHKMLALLKERKLLK